MDAPSILTDKTGQARSLQEGDVINWYRTLKDGSFIRFFERSSEGELAILYIHGHNSMLALDIKHISQFKRIAEIIGITHGLRLKPERSEYFLEFIAAP